MKLPDKESILKKVKVIKDLYIRISKLLKEKLSFKKPIIVVEIGNDWLKATENGPTPGGRAVTKISLMKLAQIKGPTALAISRIFIDLKLNKQGVITYIPRHLATVRVLELPSVDQNEIKEMVSLQLGKQTPYSKEEIISSYKILDTEREGYSKVMLVIARRSLINTRLEELQRAGINISKFTVSSEGVFSWFKNGYGHESWFKSQTNILLDIDSNYSDFLVIKEGKFVFTRSILIGANHLVEKPQDWISKFIEEIKRSIELYQNEYRGVKISKIFLSGAISDLKTLDSSLSSDLDIPVETTDPFKNIKISMDKSFLEEHEFNLVSLSCSFGVAIKHKELKFDLTPLELKIQKQVEKKRQQLTVMGALFIAVVTMISLLVLIVIYNKNTYLTILKQRIAGIEEDANEVEKMRAKIEVVEERHDARGTSLNILYEIYRLTPKQIYLKSINIEEGKKTILKGYAFAKSDVFKYVTTLESSALFADVEATYTSTIKEGEVNYADFEIVCLYEED